jgi:hypothetical protein
VSLLDQLRAAAPAVDPQFQVSSNEQAAVLSALIHSLDHGDAFTQAAGDADDPVGKTTELLAPPTADGSDSSSKADKPDTAAVSSAKKAG